MESKFVVSSSPHIRANSNTQRIMLDVIIALLPAMAVGIYFFGINAALVTFVTILSCVASEYISRKVLKRESTISDLSAVVTGLLLALNLPPTIPLWMAAIGGVVAIVIVKQLFGGLGQNFMNPALIARVFLLNAFVKQMTTFVNPGVDVISSATPLAQMKAFLKGNEADLAGYWDLFIGNVSGCIGETSAAALLIGAAYLLYRKVIGPEIPITFIGSTALLTWIFGGNTLFTGDWLYHILSGGLMIGAFFMATDYATSPVTFKGRIIMGLGCGVLTALIRLTSNNPEGVSYAILLMNICVPLIDRYTVPKSFGGGKEKPLRDIIIPTIVLFLICIIVTIALALTNYATKDAILEQNLIQEESARREVLSEADNFEEIENIDSIIGTTDEERLVKKAFKSLKDGQLIGMVYSVESKGYGGVISLAVGIDNSGKITGVKIVSLSETPGLGAKVQEDAFISQFADITPKETLTVVKSSGSKEEEIDAVSGATISSKAVVNGVQSAIDVDIKLKEKGGDF